MSLNNIRIKKLLSFKPNVRVGKWRLCARLWIYIVGNLNHLHTASDRRRPEVLYSSRFVRHGLWAVLVLGTSLEHSILFCGDLAYINISLLVILCTRQYCLTMSTKPKNMFAFCVTLWVNVKLSSCRDDAEMLKLVNRLLSTHDRWMILFFVQ